MARKNACAFDVDYVRLSISLQNNLHFTALMFVLPCRHRLWDSVTIYHLDKDQKNNVPINPVAAVSL